MVKKCLGLLVFLFGAALFANDGYFSVIGGNLVPTEMEETEVRMQEETIHIRVEEDYYEITVDFQFYNPGKTVELNVGFPFLAKGRDGYGEIYDFKCWTNDKEESFKYYPIKKDWKEETGLEYAYVRKITFKAKEITKTKVQYKCKYGMDAVFKSGSYLYGTGKPWSGPIEKMIIQIENNLTSYYLTDPSMYYVSSNVEFKRKNDTNYEAILYNIEPQSLNDFIIFDLDEFTQAKTRYWFPQGFIFKERLVTEEDVFWFNKKQLRLVRNLLYALHGYEFKSKELRDYVEKYGQEWREKYTPNPNFSEDDFSEIEKANIKFLLEQEKKW